MTDDGAVEQEAVAPLVESVRRQVTTALADDDDATVVGLLARLVACRREPSW